MKTLLFLAVLLFPVIAQAAAPVTLTWQDNSNNEAGWIIEQKLNTGSYVVIANNVPANQTTYTVSNLVQSSSVDNVYCFRVKGFLGTIQSGYTNEACHTVLKLVAVNAPTGLTVTPLSQSRLDLKWHEYCYECIAQEIVVIQTNPLKNYLYKVAPTTETYIVEGLPKNKNVSVKVHGELPDGTFTPYSNTVNARTR